MSMHVELYERMWLWASGVLIVVMLGVLGYAALGQGNQPPSHVETIDPSTVLTESRFTERGVVSNPDGSVRVRLVALMYAFLPNEIRVPAGQPVTFEVTSPDVVHGFQIVGSNANTMVIPGYVSQFTTTFDNPGEYLIVCNEYCGLGHHGMYATLIVEARQ